MEWPDSYFGGLINFFLGLSALGCLEALSVGVILLYVCTKTRASTLICSLFPALGIRCPQSLDVFTKFKICETMDTYKNDLKHQNTEGAQNLLTVRPHAGSKPYTSWLDWGKYLPDLAQNYRFRKYSYPQVCNAVVSDPNLNYSIKKAAEDILREKKNILFAENSSTEKNNVHNSSKISETLLSEDIETNLYKKILEKQERRGNFVLMDMRSKLSDLLLRITSWLLYKLFPWFLTGVVTHTKHIEMLQATAKKSPGVPLIFLPLHRSHLDYIMVTFILVNYDIRAPLVAAGKNLQIPVFGRLLRGLGAFFIKRKLDPVEGKKDIIYRSILELYLQHALKMGHNIEFFIEGGRTRTGKPLMPKGGILSVIVNSYMKGTIEDALLVPVSINYERLIDGNFIREQLGQPKKPETFRSAIAGIWKTLTSNYGLMRIDFNEPYSIKELVENYNEIVREEGSPKLYRQLSERKLNKQQSTSSLYGTDLINEEDRNLIESISRQVVYDCASATSVMTTNAIAFLLLTRFRNGVPENSLVEELDKLRAQLKGQRDLGFAGDSDQIVKYACDLLGSDLVTKQQSGLDLIIKPNIHIPNVIELAYYSNSLIPHFALESIVLTACYHLLQDKPEESGVTVRELLDASHEHCNLLRYEFILSKPTQNLDNLISDTVNNLINRNLIMGVEEPVYSEMEIKSLRIAEGILKDFHDDYSDDEEFGVGGDFQRPEIFLSKQNILEQKQILSILAPFGQSYLSVAESLNILLKNVTMLESEFIKYVIKDLTNKYERGECFGESISTDSVRNCLKLLEKMCIIEIHCNHGLKMLALKNFENIKDIINRLEAIVPKI